VLDLAAAFTTFPVLETTRFVLREVTLEDAADMYHIMSSAEAMRYFGQQPMTSPGQAVQRIQGIRNSFRERTGIRWAIAQRTTGQFIGTCGFWRLFEPHARAEVGYELAPEWWGKGVMTEAVAATLDFGFSRMKLHSIEAQIHPGNLGSRRVLEKLGFVQEGYFRENYYDPVESRFTDTVVFSLLKAAWTASTP
jgi:ribosomal-protein-alanine N-acetyltransferase